MNYFIGHRPAHNIYQPNYLTRPWPQPRPILGPIRPIIHNHNYFDNRVFNNYQIYQQNNILSQTLIANLMNSGLTTTVSYPRNNYGNALCNLGTLMRELARALRSTHPGPVYCPKKCPQPDRPTNPQPPEETCTSNPNNINGIKECNIFTDATGHTGIQNYALNGQNAGAIINQLRVPVNANITGDFSGYIAGRELTLNRSTSTTGAVTGIFHAYGTFGDPTTDPNNIPTVNIDLGAESTGDPNNPNHGIVVLGGQGNINMRGGDLVLASTRGNLTNGSSNEFNITNAKTVRIAIASGATLTSVNNGNGTKTYTDERGTKYTINDDAIVTGEVFSTVSHGRRFDIDTAALFPNNSNTVFQQGNIPHRTRVNIPGQGELNLASLLPTTNGQRPGQGTTQAAARANRFF